MEYHRSVCSAQDANANVSKIWNISALASTASCPSTVVFFRKRLEVVDTAVNACDAPSTPSCADSFVSTDTQHGSTFSKIFTEFLQKS